MKLLIVDDEKAMRDFGKPFFERRGYRVFYAPTGKEGLEMFKKETPDVVLLDLGLPDIDGQVLFTKIRESNKSSKIIILTGFGEDEIKEKLISLSPDAYFTKPCQFPLIAEKIEKMFKT